MTTFSSIKREYVPKCPYYSFAFKFYKWVLWLNFHMRQGPLWLNILVWSSLYIKRSKRALRSKFWKPYTVRLTDEFHKYLVGKEPLWMKLGIMINRLYFFNSLYMSGMKPWTWVSSLRNLMSLCIKHCFERYWFGKL